ncbi:hypothetical protein P9D43_09695 [Neobacillus niacini]|nr:hypothetical protein [Neobacillus niacini]MEC1522290.1 hypothetical protein [Neobacillus niacini]
MKKRKSGNHGVFMVTKNIEKTKKWSPWSVHGDQKHRKNEKVVTMGCSW